MHVQVQKDQAGTMSVFKRALEPYIVEPDDVEKAVYQQIRIQPKGTVVLSGGSHEL